MQPLDSFIKVGPPPHSQYGLFFFLKDPAPPEIYPFPLPAALPICVMSARPNPARSPGSAAGTGRADVGLGSRSSWYAMHPEAASDTASTTRARSLTMTRSEETTRSEEHTSELQSPCNLVCRLLLEK